MALVTRHLKYFTHLELMKLYFAELLIQVKLNFADSNETTSEQRDFNSLMSFRKLKEIFAGAWMDFIKFRIPLAHFSLPHASINKPKLYLLQAFRDG